MMLRCIHRELQQLASSLWNPRLNPISLSSPTFLPLSMIRILSIGPNQYRPCQTLLFGSLRRHGPACHSSSSSFCFHHDNHTTQCSIFLRMRAMTCWPSSVWPCMFIFIVRLYAYMPPASWGSIPCARFGLHLTLNNSRRYPRRMCHANLTVHI
jgi:hypothetical protein